MANKYWMEKMSFMNYGIYTRLPFDERILLKVFSFKFLAKRYLKKRYEDGQ